MQILSGFLFGISANIDTLVVGFTYGIKKQHISWKANLLISIITLFGTLAALGLGQQLAALMPDATAALAGSLLLLLLGVYYMIKCFWQQFKCRLTACSTPEAPAVLGLTQAAVLALALSANNAGMAIGASFTGIHFLWTSLWTLTLSLLFLLAGCKLGRLVNLQWLLPWGDLVSGLLLLALGIHGLL